MHQNSVVMIEIDYVRQWDEHYGVRSEAAKGLASKLLGLEMFYSVSEADMAVDSR